jgi:hypothetical protein
VNWSFAEVALVPPGVVTVIWTVVDGVPLGLATEIRSSVARYLVVTIAVPNATWVKPVRWLPLM